MNIVKLKDINGKDVEINFEINNFKRDFKNKFFKDFKCDLDRFNVIIPLSLKDKFDDVYYDWIHFTKYTDDIYAFELKPNHWTVNSKFILN